MLVLHALPELPAAGAYGPITIATLLALRFRRAWFLVWAAVGFVWSAHCAQLRLEQRLSAPGDYRMTGWVDDFPAGAPGQATFSLTVERPRPPGVPSRVRLTWYDPPPGLVAGAPLQLVARLKPPRGLRNPGGFDYERWLMLGGYGATGYVRSGAIAVDAQPSIARAWLEYRARLADRIAAGSPDPDAAALVTALAIGERFRFQERHWASFRRTGTSHLVAVSGMHVGLLGLVLFVAVRWLWLRMPGATALYDLEAAAVASAFGSFYYAALTGFAVPAQRSLVMIMTALAFVVSRRAVGSAQGFAVALLGVLVWDPFAPLSASFWLSFGAVGLLILLAAPRAPASPPANRLGRLAAAARATARLQWSIGCALLPLTAAFFSQASVLGPVVNFVAIPWFSFVLVPATLGATLVLSSQWLAALIEQPLLHAVGVLASATFGLLGVIAEWRWAAVDVALPSWPVLALAAGGVAFALPVHPLPGRRLAWLALVPLFVPPSTSPTAGAVRLTLLDVGHGLAVIVETHAHRLLFDAGPRYPSGYDTGDNVVVPALRASSHSGLDLVIVSHADNDHSGGVRAVLDEFPSARVLAGPDVDGLPAEVCRRGEHWRWDGVEFAILHPPANFAPRGNDSSCVLRVSAAGRSILIAGDIEARAERTLSAQPLAADVVVVPHHGSATSSSAGFVAGVDAAYALVSAGHGNRWGFPRPEVRARWERSGADVLVTGERGAVTVLLGPSGVAVRTERARRHYWDARSRAAQS